MSNVNRKAVRVISVLGVLLAICGLRFWEVLGEGFARSWVGFQAGLKPASVDFWDVESALSRAMEPIGPEKMPTKKRQVAADDSTGGEPVTVILQLDGLPRQIHGDANGVFPPVSVRAHQQVHVKVSYPEGLPGEVVQIQTQDGGTIETDASARVVSLDEERVVSFWFESSGNEGTHRVTFRRGFDEKTLDFWVGSKPALHVVR